jgi:hypothetical protein
MADTFVFEITPVNDWRTRFRLIEMKILAITEWQASLPKALKRIKANYAAIHQLNVDALNQGLPLAILLRTTDFDGDTTLIDLREDVVAPRIQPLAPIPIDLGVDEEELTALDMDHLLE